MGCPVPLSVGSPWVIFKDTLRNTPEQALWDWPYRFWMPYMPEQWFYSE